MKAMTKTFFVLGLLACILSISSADDLTVPTTNQATQPGGDVSSTSPSESPSPKDLEKAADPTFQASLLETPVSWLLTALSYIWSYAIVEPISLAIDLALEPITLSLDAVIVPLNFIFGDFLEPIENFLSEGFEKSKDLIWWLFLESISYGSGATADSVAAAMELALNGLLEFFTEIGLPIANTAEKLSVVTDQLANVRKKRSITDAAGTLGSGIMNLIKFPFLVIGTVFSYISYPIRMIFNVVTFPFTFLFGSPDEGDSIYTLLLTDMNIDEITDEVLEAAWNFMKNTGIPELDSIARQLMKIDSIPSVLREILVDFDSIYSILKMFGYVK